MVIYDIPPVTLIMSRELRDYAKKMCSSYGFGSYSDMFDFLSDEYERQGIDFERLAKRRRKSLTDTGLYSGQSIQMTYIVSRKFVDRVRHLSNVHQVDKVLPRYVHGLIAWFMETQGLISRLDREDHPGVVVMNVTPEPSMGYPPEVVINSLNATLYAEYAPVAGTIKAATKNPLFEIRVTGKGSVAIHPDTVQYMMEKAGMALTPETTSDDVSKAILSLCR